MTNRIGQQLGNYRLLRLLGQGGFADVYLGEHIHLHTQAAIKILQVRLGESSVQSFLNEARMIAHLVHPYIIRVLDFGAEDTIPFLVMDYASNGTFRQRFLHGKPLPPTPLFPYIKQTANALQYAHNNKLIHRDVKPENMLIGPNGEVLLSDFGFALIQSSISRSSTETAGTAAYMAPEQLQGQPRPASDQYALGVVAYEWLTGQCPFHGTFFEIASQHMLTPPPPIREKVPHVSPELEHVIMRALDKDADKRFATVSDFAEALEKACLSSKMMALSPPLQTPEVGSPRAIMPVSSSPSAQLPFPGEQTKAIVPASQSPSKALAGVDPLAFNSVTNQFAALTSLADFPPLAEGTKETPEARPAPFFQGKSLPNASQNYPSLQQGQPGRPPAAPSGIRPINTGPSFSGNQDNKSGFYPSMSQTSFSNLPPLEEPSSWTLPPAGNIPSSAPAAFSQSGIRPISASFDHRSAQTPAFASSSKKLPIATLLADARQKSARGNMVLLISIVIFFLIGSLVLFSLTRNGQTGNENPGNENPSLSSQEQQATSTAAAQASSTAGASTATSQAIANPYPPHVGSLSVNSSLASNDDASQWEESSVCVFANSAYHVLAASENDTICFANGYEFSDFTYQIDMAFAATAENFSSGGIVFRANTLGEFYYFALYATGHFSFQKCTAGIAICTVLVDGMQTADGQPATPLSSFNASQTNTLAVTAADNTITLYVNDERIIEPFIDSENFFSQGLIGVYSYGGLSSTGTTTDVFYSNVKVWK